MEIILIVSAVLLIVYGLWFFKNLIASGKAKRIHRGYQTVLDQKLLPLGFERQQTIVGGQEKITSYKQRGSLEINLCYEISYDANRILMMGGKQSKNLNLNDTIDTKNSCIQSLEKWLVENS